ncbi:MAG: hypothetical protein IRZ05_16835 [Micromonosporaceae bacterium]|nr:hypothetical protein [Micromonosporaceae bacterium]
MLTATLPPRYGPRGAALVTAALVSTSWVTAPWPGLLPVAGPGSQRDDD